MIEIMIDIETLGTTPDSVVLEIAAYPFSLNDELARGLPYHVVVSTTEQVKSGRRAALSCIEWWKHTSPDRLTELLTDRDAVPISAALDGLTNYVAGIRHCNDSIGVWAHSPSFDLVMLEDCYRQLGRKPPWTYREQRDVRTWLLAHGAQRPSDVLARGTEEHYALEDAVYQAQVVQEALWRIGRS